jgi:serine/threonine protein kinase
LSESEAIEIVIPVLEGLKEVHSYHYLHRDIKPDNILLRPNALPVLIDFGASRSLQPGGVGNHDTVLTLGYAPPEQADPRIGPQGPWTDLYAVGAVIYRMITGQTPPDQSERRAGEAIRLPLERFRGYSRHFLQAVERSLEWRTDRRFQSASSFQRALLGAA